MVGLPAETETAGRSGGHACPGRDARHTPCGYDVVAFAAVASNLGGKMLPDQPVHDPQHWRDRAKRARAKADQAKNPKSKRMLQGIAGAYERLADKAKRRLRMTEKAQP